MIEDSTAGYVKNVCTIPGHNLGYTILSSSQSSSMEVVLPVKLKDLVSIWLILPLSLKSCRLAL